MPIKIKDAEGNDIEIPDAKEIAEMVTGAVRSTVSKAIKLEDLAARVTESLGLEGKLEELGKKLDGRVVDNPDDGAPAPPKSKDGAVQRLEERLAAMNKSLEEERMKREAAERQRIQAEQQRVHAEAVAQLRAQLADKVRPEMLDLVVRDLDKGQGRIVLDDGGRPLLKVSKAPFHGAPPEEVALPLQEAIPTFIEGEGKLFARGTGGGGSPDIQSLRRPPLIQAEPGKALTHEQRLQNYQSMMAVAGIDPFDS